MLALENADEILQILDRFTKQKSKDIPPELEDYINYVAKTGDTVYRWPTIQYLFREKLRNVIKDFHDTTASIEGMYSSITQDIQFDECHPSELIRLNYYSEIFIGNILFTQII